MLNQEDRTSLEKLGFMYLRFDGGRRRKEALEMRISSPPYIANILHPWYINTSAKHTIVPPFLVCMYSQHLRPIPGNFAETFGWL